MAVPTPPTHNPPPTPPSRDDPANFATRGDAFLGWFPAAWAYLSQLVAWIAARTEEVFGNASAAATAQAAAEASAAVASAAAASASNSGNAAATATAQAVAAAASASSAQAAKVAAEQAVSNAVAVVTGGTASLKAAPGKIPLADANGMLDPSWAAAGWSNTPINHIGVPGTAGFGVGICPQLPAGFTPMAGCTDRLSANYGNYLYSDGSVMVWIPAFYMRLSDPGNPTYATYGVNSIDIKPLSAYPDEATANASSYYLHRAFVNAGQNQLGFFRDKYDCSLNGNIASSIQGVQPMVCGPIAGQVGFSGATGNGQAPANMCAGAIAAARSRGSKFFPETIFMADAITRITEAHAQASSSTTYCAWWSSGATNFPKGNNNGNLRDVNDSGVVFTSAGNFTYPNFALAGSGAPFAKTTHNGQACGVADVNGNIYKINPGLTCVATSKNITAATLTNPVQLSVAAHGLTTGTVVLVASVVGMTQINDRMFTVTVIDANTVSLDGVDGTAFSPYVSGGSVSSGRFYALKASANIESLTAGNTLSTDLWGTVGMAANFDEVALNFVTAYPSNTVFQTYGNLGNQVFDWGTSTARLRSMLGMPALAGVSVSGTSAMGNDRYSVGIRNELCVIGRGSWVDSSAAGGRFRYLSSHRALSHYHMGFAATRYL